MVPVRAFPCVPPFNKEGFSEVGDHPRDDDQGEYVNSQKNERLLIPSV